MAQAASCPARDALARSRTEEASAAVVSAPHLVDLSMRAGGTAPAPRGEYRSLRGPVKGFALGGSLPARKLAGSPFRPRPAGDRPAPLPGLPATGAGAEVWPTAPGQALSRLRTASTRWMWCASERGDGGP